MGPCKALSYGLKGAHFMLGENPGVPGPPEAGSCHPSSSGETASTVQDALQSASQGKDAGVAHSVSSTAAPIQVPPLLPACTCRSAGRDQADLGSNPGAAMQT